jgi:Ca-activated chloride channel family protein
VSTLYWREPLWALLGLLPVCWLAIGAWQAARLRQRYAEPALWPWALDDGLPTGSRWRRAALLVSWGLLGLAAAGPRLPAYLPPDQDHAAASLAVVLDISRSMDAQDVWPSRRRLALRGLEDLLPQLSGSRVGLIVTAGHAHPVWPISNDRHGLASLVAQLHALQPPSQGSDLAAGVRLASTQLANAPGTRLLLLLTDGDLDATRQQALSTALRQAGDNRIQLLIAGIGTQGGAALPGNDGSWLQQDDQPVLSRLARERLAALAESLGGQYLTLPEQAPAQALLARLPGAATRLRLQAGDAVLWQELFPWLLAPAVLLWLLAVLHLPRAAVPAGLVTTAVYLSGLLLVLPARADTLTQAHQALLTGDLPRARALYADLPGYAARMGSGATCHALGDWSCARQAFARAVLAAPTDDARARAIYNLAHSVFQSGDYAGAAALFDDALRYRADYPAARHNRDYTRELAAEVARLAGGPQADRAGRASAMAAPGEAGNLADSRLTLGGRDTVSPEVRPTRPSQRQALLARGLAFTQLAASRSAEANAPWGQVYGGEASGSADITLWQGLLERAEGLPATPSQPRILPGVRPW